MKKQPIIDERIAAQMQKIRSDAFGILVCCLLITVLIKQYAFKASFWQFSGELLCIAAAGGYVLLQNILTGSGLHAMKENSKKDVVINSMIAGLISTILLAVLAGSDNLLVIFIAITGLIMLAKLAAYSLCCKRQQQLDARLEDDV